MRGRADAGADRRAHDRLLKTCQNVTKKCLTIGYPNAIIPLGYPIASPPACGRAGADRLPGEAPGQAWEGPQSSGPGKAPFDAD